MFTYWRTTGAATFTSRPTANHPLFTAASPFSDYGFDGPFFDLDFALSNQNDEDVASETEIASGDSEDMREVELNLDVDAPDLNISPTTLNIPEDDSKSAASLVKSAANFRLLLLKLTKSDPSNGVDEKRVDKSEKSEAVRVRYRVGEVKGPLISLFARDYCISEDSSASLGKEMMQKYLNVLKPLYLGVEKMKMVKTGLRGNNQLQGRFQVVHKHLGKRRSTSAV